MTQLKVIDARGLPCPQPLMATKAKLQGLSVGESFEVWLDNDTACANVTRFLEQMGCLLAVEKGDGVLVVRAEKRLPSEAVSHFSMVDSNCDTRASEYVLVIAQDSMGQGDDSLGRLLMQGAMNALREVRPRPSSIVFYNSGVKLACDGSAVLEVLKELDKDGVRMLVCGTCLNFFGLKDKLSIGQVSNMFEILELVARAGHTFRP